MDKNGNVRWYNNQRYVLPIALSMAVFAILSPFLFVSLLPFDNTTGPIGDTFGGIVNPFITLITAYLMYMAFRQQELANKQQNIETQRQLDVLNEDIKRRENVSTEQLNLLVDQITIQKYQLELLKINSSKEWLLALLKNIHDLQETLVISFVDFKNTFKLSDISMIREGVRSFIAKNELNGGSYPFNHMDMAFEYVVIWLGWDKALEFLEAITYRPRGEGFDFGQLGIVNENSPGYPYTWNLDSNEVSGLHDYDKKLWDAEIIPFSDSGVRRSFTGLMLYVQAAVNAIKQLSLEEEDKFKSLLMGQLSPTVFNLFCNIYVTFYVLNPNINYFGTKESSKPNLFWRDWVQLYDELRFVEYLGMLRQDYLHDVDYEAWPTFDPKYVDPRLMDGYQAPH